MGKRCRASYVIFIHPRLFSHSYCRSPTSATHSPFPPAFLFVGVQSKKLAFIDVLADGGGRIQVVASMGRFADKAAFATQVKQLRRGDVVEFEGHAGKTKIGELSVFAHTVQNQGLRL